MYARSKELVTGKTVLCLGCGSGEECQEMLNMGATRVIGTDPAEGLIEEGRKAFPQVEFHVLKAEDHSSIPDASVDVIYSSFAVHYIRDWATLFADMKRILKPGGRMLFSTIHPGHWGMVMIKDRQTDVRTYLMGYSADPDTQQITVYGDYLNCYEKEDRFMGKIHVKYFVRPISHMWRAVTNAGFHIADMIEPKSIQTNVPQEFRAFGQATQKVPYVIIFELQKPESKGA